MIAKFNVVVSVLAFGASALFGQEVQSLLPPRPPLLVQLSEDVWQKLEASEAYRAALSYHPRDFDFFAEYKATPQAKATYVNSATDSKQFRHHGAIAIDTAVWTASLAVGRQSTKVPDVKAVIYIISLLKTRLGSSVNGQPFQMISRIDEIAGSLYPFGVGNELLVRVGYGQSKLAMFCRIDARLEASALFANVPGALWQASCGDPDKSAEPVVDYFVEDLGIWVSEMGSPDGLFPAVGRPQEPVRRVFSAETLTWSRFEAVVGAGLSPSTLSSVSQPSSTAPAAGVSAALSPADPSRIVPQPAVTAAPVVSASASSLPMSDENSSFVLVHEVSAGSAGERAGVRPGDVILQFGGTDLEDGGEIATIEKERYKAGDVVDLVVLRSGAQLRMKATLGADNQGYPILGVSTKSVPAEQLGQYTTGDPLGTSAAAALANAMPAGSFQLPDAKAHTAAQVGAISIGGPATSAGLLLTDVILQYGGVFPEGMDALNKLEKEGHQAGETVELTVLRQVSGVTWRQVRTRMTLGAGLDGRPDSGVVWRDAFVSGRGTQLAAFIFIPRIEELPGANKTQIGDLKRMREIRADYLDLIAADWPTETIAKKKTTDRLGCTMSARRVEVTTLAPGSDPSYERVEIPACAKGGTYNVRALTFSPTGTWHVGEHVFSGGYIYPNGTIISLRKSNLLYFNGADQCTYAYFAPGNQVVFLRQKDTEAFACADAGKTIQTTAFAARFGAVEGETSPEGFVAANPATLVAPDGSWKAFGHTTAVGKDRINQARRQGISDLGEFDASIRIDTKTETRLGPAGTYLASGPLFPGDLPLAGNVQPAPGLLAKNAAAADACPFHPAVPEGWLAWAPNCKSDTTHFDAWAVDGSYRMRFTSGQPSVLQSFDPERPGIPSEEWRAESFSNTQPPAPLGPAELWQNGLLTYRGTFAGLEPEGAGQCAVDGSTNTEPCRFADGKRVDTLYVARIAQQALDHQTSEQQKAVSNQVVARAAERTRIAEEKASAARLQAEAEVEAERAEKQARSAARAATFGAILSGVTQGLTEAARNAQASSAAISQATAAQYEAAMNAKRAEVERQQQAAVAQQQTVSSGAQQNVAQQRAALAAQQRQTIARQSPQTTTPAPPVQGQAPTSSAAQQRAALAAQQRQAVAAISAPATAGKPDCPPGSVWYDAQGIGARQGGTCYAVAPQAGGGSPTSVKGAETLTSSGTTSRSTSPLTTPAGAPINGQVTVSPESPKAKKIEWGPIQLEAIAICRQNTKSGKWACNNQTIVDEPTLESALSRQGCSGGIHAAGGPVIEGLQWEAYRCGHSLGAGDDDMARKYGLITARRPYMCPKFQGGSCATIYDGQDQR